MTNHHFTNMDPRQIIKEYKEFIDGMIIEDDKVDYNILSHHLRLLEKIAMIENSSLTVFDMHQKKYVFVRNRMKDIIDYDEKEALDQGFSYFFKIMHPDDVSFVIDTSLKAFKFLAEVPPDERADYKTVFEFRLRSRNGEYIRFIQQIAVLELDLAGNIWLLLIVVDLCPSQSKRRTFQRSMFNIKANKSYLFFEENNRKKTSLSKREIEILGLLATGMDSMEIAEQLFISVNTVNNHRQNIIAKMEVADTKEALVYAQKVGII